jgi:hypothetical protein
MYLQKVKSRKTLLKNQFFVGFLKVNDENSRTRIRIRIHTKMSWIRNTGLGMLLLGRQSGQASLWKRQE